jgi:hypothetical protein
MEDQFKLFVAGLCTLSGLPLAVGTVPAPQSLESVLSPLGRQLWGFSLAIGGGLVVWGILMRNVWTRRRYIEGLMIEAAGLIPLGLAALVVCTLAIYVLGSQALFGGTVYAMFTVACASRYWAIHTVVKTLRQAINQEEDKGRESE